MKKFAIILSGCGVYDGSEIHEATMLFLSIISHGGEYDCFAPNINQIHTINHSNGEISNENRNVLIESARIARGEIISLDLFDANNYDALVLPGGYGVAKNLSDYYIKGENCIVIKSVAEAIKNMHNLSKPIGAMCIAPVIIAKVLGDVTLTIGNDETTADTIEKMGSKHVNTSYGEVIADKKHKIFSTPCYMLDSNIKDVYDGASNLVKSILENID